MDTVTVAPIVTAYLAAADSGDIPALADCFTADGYVIDEGHTYTGRDAIIGWREALVGQWIYTSRVTGTSLIGPDEFRVSVRVEGNFPGGVADLAFQVALRGERISALVIV
jgi:hypothetical protein